MKIKVKTRDFIVEEISNIELKGRGDYAVFKLKKDGCDMLEVIKSIALKLHLRLGDIGYAGIKDRYAQTSQYITIRLFNGLPKEVSGKDYYMKLVGYTDTAIKVGDLVANKFVLTLRELTRKEVYKIDRSFKSIEDTGFINYYDSQRFGSTKNNVFIAKYILKKDYERALKQFIFSQYEENQKQKLKPFYDKLDKNWHNFGYLNIKIPFLDFLQREYNKTKSWKLTYKKIPVKLRELILTSYQSYLWNECVKEVLEINFTDFARVNYNVGELYFPIKKIDSFCFPLIGRKLLFTSEQLLIIEKVLQREDITQEEIKQVSKSGSFLKSSSREAVVYPKNMSVIEILKDDIYKNYFKIKLSFELPKGSYATVLIKQITS